MNIDRFAKQAHRRGVLAAVLALMVAVPISGIPQGAAAQSSEIIDLYDFDDDGEVDCDDFRFEYPEMFTDEATAAMERYPDELSRLNADPDEDDTACDGQPGAAGPEPQPVDPEPIPSDLPSDLPTTFESPTPTTVEAPGECDVEVQNGRAFVFTDCADGTVRAGFEPFEGFDEFAARAQNGFGAFDGSDSAGTTAIEVQQAVPVSGSNSTTTSRDSASSETRLVEGEQRARGGKAKQAKRKKARKAKAKKQRAADRKAKRKRQMRSDPDD